MLILDSRNSLADYSFQVALEARPSKVYSKNGIKAAKNREGISVLHLISLSIVHKNNFFPGYTRQEIYLTFADMAVACAPSLDELSMLVSNCN